MDSRMVDFGKGGVDTVNVVYTVYTVYTLLAEGLRCGSIVVYSLYSQ